MPVRARPNQGRSTTFPQQHSCRVPGRNRRRRHFERHREECAPNLLDSHRMIHKSAVSRCAGNGTEALELFGGNLPRLSWTVL
jgi:hypothetical protein